MRNVHRIDLKFKDIKKCRELLSTKATIIKRLKPLTIQLNPSIIEYKMGVDYYKLKHYLFEIEERALEIAEVRLTNLESKVHSVNWTITSDNYIEVRVVINNCGKRNTDFFILKEA